MSNEVKKEFESTNILLFFIRWWKHLGVIVFVAALAGAIFSSPFFITPLFESHVSMFPASSGSLGRSAADARYDFLRYGEVEDAERLLQVLESSAISERITQRFNLMEHYGIPETSSYKYTQLRGKYDSNISARRTPFGAVIIRVRDKDPKMAADIANEIAALSDTIQNEIRRERAAMNYRVSQDRYESIKAEVAQIQDSLRVLAGKGLFHFEGQVEMYSKQLAKDISSGNQRGISDLEGRLESISAHGGTYVALVAYAEELSKTLTLAQSWMIEARADVENFVPFKFMIDRAYESERKVYPVRWLIVFLSAFAAGFMGIMGIMIYENLKDKGIIK